MSLSLRKLIGTLVQAGVLWRRWGATIFAREEQVAHTVLDTGRKRSVSDHRYQLFTECLTIRLRILLSMTTQNITNQKQALKLALTTALVFVPPACPHYIE